MTTYSRGQMLQLLQADVVYCNSYGHPEGIWWGRYSVTVGTAVDDRLSRLKKTELIKVLFND